MIHTHEFVSTDKDGNRMAFRVEIDSDAIAAKLARRLRTSKTGKAVALDGAVKATRIKEPK